LERHKSWAPPEEASPEQKKYDKFAIAGFLYSVLWLILLFASLTNVIGAVLGSVAGIVLSTIGLKSSKRKTAVMGLIVSIVCILLTVVSVIFSIIYKK
jgi:hypothetical protein